MNIVAILLAAGSATRFGSDKLLHCLPHEVPMAVQAARHLRAVFEEKLFAVVRPQNAGRTLYAIGGLWVSLLRLMDDYAKRLGTGSRLICHASPSRGSGWWCARNTCSN